MGYNVGNLELDLEVKNIDAAISKFESLSKTINSLNGTDINIGGGNSGNGLLDQLSPKKIASAFNFKDILNKLYAFKNNMKPYIESMKKIVNLGIDYNETLNLWQVAMGKNVDLAEEFVTKMNKAYGIATETLMKYQATFRNMLSSLGGISDDMSYALSESIMQMAVDYASLYNTTTEKAMTLFQQVLAGQTKSIRSTSGYDITETTIYELYQQLGGTKTMRNLSQLEKRLLRIYAVYQQMDRSRALGDTAKTIEYTANQVRMMKEEWKELTTWIGKWFELVIQPHLKYINAALITAIEIIKKLVTSLPQYEDFNGAESGINGLITGLEETEDEIDEVQGKLLGFDKFRALNSSDDETSISIDDKIAESIKNISSILADATTEAQGLAKKWLAFWIDPDTREWTDEAEDLYKAIVNIGKALGPVATTLAALKIGASVGTKIVGQVKAIAAVIPIIKDAFALLSLSAETGMSLGAVAEGVGGVSSAVSGLASGLSFLSGPVGIILAIVAALYVLNEDFRNSVNDLFETLVPLVKLLFNLISNVLSPIFDLAKGIIDVVGELCAIIVQMVTPMVMTLVEETVMLLVPVEAILKVLQSIVQVLADIFSFNFSEIGENLKDIWTNWSSIDTLKEVHGKRLTYSLSAHKNGGVVEDGIFTMSKGEIIGDFDDGTTVVANNQQIISGIEQGVYKAVSAAMQGGNSGSSNKNVYNFQVNGRTLLSVMEDEMHKQGKKLSRY